MIRASLLELSVKELVERFTAASLGQFDAELQSNIPAQNRFVRETMAIAEELRTRPEDQRAALAELYEHPNVQVRLNAARLTLAVTPAARQVVQAIADSREYPQAMDAGMCLWSLDQGLFKPT